MGPAACLEYEGEPIFSGTIFQWHANWFSQKYLPSDTSFSLWPQVWPGWWQIKLCHHPLIALMVNQVTNLRKNMMSLLWSSPMTQERAFLWANNCFPLRVEEQVPAMYSLLQKMPEKPWGILLCSAECVKLSLTKLTMCQSGKFSLQSMHAITLVVAMWLSLVGSWLCIFTL